MLSVVNQYFTMLSLLAQLLLLMHCQWMMLTLCVHLLLFSESIMFQMMFGIPVNLLWTWSKTPATQLPRACSQREAPVKRVLVQSEELRPLKIWPQWSVVMASWPATTTTEETLRTLKKRWGILLLLFLSDWDWMSPQYQTHRCKLYACMYTYNKCKMCGFLCMQLCTHMGASMHTHTCRSCKHTHTHTPTHMYTHMYTHTHTHTHMYTHTHTHTHTHTQTHTQTKYTHIH